MEEAEIIVSEAYKKILPVYRELIAICEEYNHIFSCEIFINQQDKNYIGRGPDNLVFKV